MSPMDWNMFDDDNSKYDILAEPQVSSSPSEGKLI